MKRLLAKLLSFLLMLVMILSVVCRLSENFPLAYKITGIKGCCNESGEWEIYTNRTDGEEKLLTIPVIGKAIEGIAEPRGFAVCTAIYFLLLFMGRKRNTPQSTDSAVYRRYSDDYDCCSVGDTVSDAEVSEDEVSGFLSVSDISLDETSLPETS